MSDLKRVHSKEQISEVVLLAREIWTEHYVPIIGQQQVDYMLEQYQSESAIAGQMSNGYEYYLMLHDGQSVGYIAIVPKADEDALMISKLYVKKSKRGHGFGRKMLRFAENVCRVRHIKTLWLTVNKHNLLSIAWYTRMEFNNAGPTFQDIGAGFVMDDYRMEKIMGQPSRADGFVQAEPVE